MTLSYILMQNLRRNPLRASLTAAAFALPTAIFVAAISFVVALTGVKDANASQLRPAVRHAAKSAQGQRQNVMGRGEIRAQPDRLLDSVRRRFASSGVEVGPRQECQLRVFGKIKGIKRLGLLHEGNTFRVTHEI